MKYKKMKCFLCVLLLTLCSFVLEAKEFSVTLEVRRSAVRLGEYIQLILHSDKKVDKIDYPVIPGAKWAENIQSSGTRYVNGKVSHMKTLYLAPEKEASFTIPPFKVYSGKDSGTTQELKVRVLPREQMNTEEGKSYKISDIVKGSISITPAGRNVYAGEEMVITCDLLVDERFTNQIQLSYYPEFTRAGNALFTTFAVRGGKTRFKADRPVQVVEKDTPFIRYRFTAFCRVLKPGPFAPGATQKVGVIRTDRTREDPFDGFFGGMGGFFSSSSVEPYTVNYTQAPPVEIKALPTPPAGVFNTFLVGKWQVKGALSSTSLRQGEVCELLLTFQGTGSPENFSAPQITAPGFRVYPAEVEKKGDTVTAKYAMIPLETGELEIKLCPGTFDSTLQKWVSTPLEFKAAVLKGAAAAPAGVQKNFAPAPPQAPAAPAPAGEEERNFLLYQKNAPGALVKLPLVKNALGIVFFFALICPLAALGIELFFRRREKEASSPELRRKKELKKELRQLAFELNSKGDSAEFRSRLIPVLGEALGLSAGAAAGEIAEKMSDEELCSYFSRLDFAGFSPVNDEKELKLDSSAKKALLKLLKSLSLIALLFFFLPGVSGTELNSEFNAGNFAAAAPKYMALAQTPEGCRPDMLYNYGNARYRQGNLPEARWALTRALLLKPWDGEIKANLQLVNGHFFKNPGTDGSFSANLRAFRDQIRCDHYLIAGAFFWALIWFLWSFRRKISSGILSTATFICAFLCLLCLTAFFTQMQSTYSDKRIIITVPQAELRTLPGKNAGSVETAVTGGSEAEVIQYDNSGFARVRLDKREGWLPVQSFKSL